MLFSMLVKRSEPTSCPRSRMLLLQRMTPSLRTPRVRRRATARKKKEPRTQTHKTKKTLIAIPPSNERNRSVGGESLEAWSWWLNETASIEPGKFSDSRTASTTKMDQADDSGHEKVKEMRTDFDWNWSGHGWFSALCRAARCSRHEVCWLEGQFVQTIQVRSDRWGYDGKRIPRWIGRTMATATPTQNAVPWKDYRSKEVEAWLQDVWRQHKKDNRILQR